MDRVNKIVQHLAPQACAGSEDYAAQLNSLLASESIRIAEGVRVPKEYLEVLTPDVLRFLATLHRKFDGRRRELLFKRELRQFRLDAGEMPDFLPETKHIREGHWKAAVAPADLQDRRIEITGPVDRKMVINALNSGASCFMADFEDSTSPTFDNCVMGQINLRDAVRGTIALTTAAGKSYKLNDKIATLLVRARGWHLEERHVLVDGMPMSGSLFDFGIYFFINAKALLAKGSGPYFYCPKLESHLEARLWNDVFNCAQDYIGIPRGTIRATVLCESLLASFEIDEIIYELRDHSAGLNAGRWDYLFSYMKFFRNLPGFVTPQRPELTMTIPFMEAYVKRLVQVCHKRGVHAMGGMSASIPAKNDPKTNEATMAALRADKLREVKAGHDGSWIAHPALLGEAKKVFDEHMPTPNQIHRIPDTTEVTAADLVRVPLGTIPPAAVDENLHVSILYVEAWLRGVGCIPYKYKMEDLATAECARGQLWQWCRHGAKMSNGESVSRELLRSRLPKVLDNIRAEIGQDKFAKGRFDLAARLVFDSSSGEAFPAYMSLVAYQYI